MGFLSRHRKRPPIVTYSPSALFPVTVELSESWVQMPYVGNVPEQRMGPSYRWTPQLTGTTRQALTHILNTQVHGVKVSGGTGTTISLHASCTLTGLDLNKIRTFIEGAEEMSIAEAKPVAV